jgi:hypothetical protein
MFRMGRILVAVRSALLAMMVAVAAGDCGGSGAGDTGSGGKGEVGAAGAAGMAGQGGTGGGLAGAMGEAGTGGASGGSAGGGAGAGAAGNRAGAGGGPIAGSGGGGGSGAGGGSSGSKGSGGGGGSAGSKGGAAGGGAGSGGGAAGGGAAGSGGGASGSAGTNTGWTSIPNDLLHPWPVADRFPWLVYDSGRGVVVLLLGDNSTTAPLAVWDLDVTTSRWTNRQPTPAPSLSVWPISRSVFGAAYDPVHARTFLFGGYDLMYYADLWAWNGAAGMWTNLTPPMPYPSNWPGVRDEHGLVYDSDRGKLVLFGGLGGNVLLNDLWECDPATGTWINRTPNPLPAVWPGPRQGVSMVYDQSRKRVVLFGGDNAPPFSGTSSPLAELWEWDGTAGVWTNRTPASLPAIGWPPARGADYAMVYDPTRARTLFFADETIPQDFWEWNGGAGSWIDRTPNPIPATAWPPRRQAGGMTIVPRSDLLVMFGGIGYPPSGGFGSLDDLWYWQAPAAGP